MIVIVKEYLKETHEVLCEVEKSENEGDHQKTIRVDPFVTCAILTGDSDYQKIGFDMVGKYYQMEEWAFNDTVYCPKSFKHIPSFVVPDITFKDFVEYRDRPKGNFPDDLGVSIGGTYRHKNGKQGILIMFDFGENEINVYIGDGLFWEGTGQEFREQWK